MVGGRDPDTHPACKGSGGRGWVGTHSRRAREVAVGPDTHPRLAFGCGGGVVVRGKCGGSRRTPGGGKRVVEGRQPVLGCEGSGVGSRHTPGSRLDAREV